jgi:hypothetical protein
LRIARFRVSVRNAACSSRCFGPPLCPESEIRIQQGLLLLESSVIQRAKLDTFDVTNFVTITPVSTGPQPARFSSIHMPTITWKRIFLNHL